MSLWELFVIAVGLSMDAFAVAICKGLSVGRVRGSHAVTAGIYFGGFQMLMPLLGYLLGVRFQEIIAGVDHWIAFLLLGLIGANMIRESRGGEEHVDSSFRPRSMLPLAVATSIDALAVGVSFAFLGMTGREILGGGCPDRRRHLCAFGGGSACGQCVRQSLQVQGGAVRRRDP